MNKRLLADYRWMDYRMLAEKLDELAQEGWQLQKESLFGLIFDEVEPEERCHRLMYVPKDEDNLPPTGWTVVRQKGEQRILYRHQAMTTAEELALDQEMRPMVRKVLVNNLLQLAGLMLTVLTLTFSWRHTNWEYVLQQDKILVLAAVLMAAILGYMALCTVFDLWEVLRFHWAVIDERLYEPLWQGYGLRWLGTLCILGMGLAFLVLFFGAW